MISTRRGFRFFSIDRRYQHLTKVDTSRIPYAVNRSSSGNLPVYTKFRGVNRTPTTYVNSVFGDSQTFISDMRTAVCADASIREDGRTLEISGRFARPLKNGFRH